MSIIRFEVDETIWEETGFIIFTKFCNSRLFSEVDAIIRYMRDKCMPTCLGT